MSQNVDPLVLEIAGKLDLAPAVVAGCLGDLARQNETKESQGRMAKRWGVGFGQLTKIRHMGRVAISEVREGLVTQKMIIANKLDEVVMDGLNDPEKVEKLSLKDASVMAKQYTDSALNLANGQVGAPATQINVGDLKILIDRRNQSGPYVPIKQKIGKVIEATTTDENTN
jgi:hypothetical protein